MKKSLIRVLSLVLCLSMVFALTTGCSKKEAAAETTTAAAETTTAAAETTTAAAETTAAAAETTTAAAANSGEKYTIRFSTVNSPESTAYKGMEAFKDALEKSTNGQITVELYHSGSLYTDETQYDAMDSGDLEMIYTDQFWLANKIPYLSTLTAAYAFDSYDHMEKVLNGDIGKKIYDDVASQLGYRPLGACYFGSRVLSFRKGLGKTIKTPDDMKGLIFRMPNTDAYLAIGKALGANPTPLSLGEVYTAEQTGTIDGQDNPLSMLDSNSFYEVTESITLTNHIMSSVWPTISEKFWKTLSPDLQQKVQDAVKTMIDTEDKTVLDSESTLADKFKGMGIQIITPDVAVWSDHVHQYYKDNADLTKDWDMDLYNQIQAAK
jgi:tripartite ATP-independent transporter DctP family solute receptor